MKHSGEVMADNICSQHPESLQLNMQEFATFQKAFATAEIRISLRVYFITVFTEFGSPTTILAQWKAVCSSSVSRSLVAKINFCHM
jgi:hypothetical protein